MKQANAEDEEARNLTVRNQEYKTWEQHLESPLSVSEESSAQIKARPGMTARVFEKVDRNIT